MQPLIVGTIIVTSCAVAMTNLKNEAANQQLSNVDEYVATQSLTLINQANENGQNATQVLDLPTAIGNQEYWISLANDSSSAWVESGFGSFSCQSAATKFTFQQMLPLQERTLAVGAAPFCNVTFRIKL